MCLSATVIFVLIFTKLETIPAEESTDTFNSINSPSTVNFNEIFTNSLALLDDPNLTSATKDEDFHLHFPSQFVEFRPRKQETTTMLTPPPPKYIMNSSYLKKENETSEGSSGSNQHSTYTVPPLIVTLKPKNISVNVIPIAAKKQQRGVLDLLFPAARVRTFKGVFDTFRRILSYTFRKR